MTFFTKSIFKLTEVTSKYLDIFHNDESIQVTKIKVKTTMKNKSGNLKETLQPQKKIFRKQYHVHLRAESLNV